MEHLEQKPLTFWEKYQKYSIIITRVLAVFLIGLVIVLTSIHGSSDASVHDNSWKVTFRVLDQSTLTSTTNAFLSAFKNQNMTQLERVCSESCLQSLPLPESRAEEVKQAMIEVFGGEDVLTEEIITDIDTFSHTICSGPIVSYQINDSHIRDNIGRVSVTISRKPDVALIQDIDITEVVSKATATYADAHKQELVQLYSRNKDEKEITRTVIEGIYKEILDAIKEKYEQIPVDNTNYLLVIYENNGRYMVQNMLEQKEQSDGELVPQDGVIQP